MASLNGQAWMIAARWTVAVLVAAAPLALVGCDNEAGTSVARVKAGGKTFTLELALEDATRFKGLSGRTHIEDDGGILFVFPPSQVRVQGFVMRDCPIPIDIIYLDGAGRVLTTHAMVPEAPRGEGEGTPGESNPNMKYNTRLKQYSSRYPATFVIEVKGGTLPGLNLKEGDKVEIDDLEGLKKRAK